jgi:DNA ligase-associated metallophosphoesterase
MEKKETPNIASAIVAGEQLMLHPFRGIYWEKEQMLLLADLHLGKAMHFRRAGIPVPSAVSHSNWDRLIALLLDFEPERVVFLGDLFHSDYNSEWKELADLIHQFNHIDFELVIGNHDILDKQNYEQAGLISHGTALIMPPFLFTHEPTLAEEQGLYNLAGHIHPCVRLRGKGRQRLRLPCFYFSPTGGILPAFGAFTGMGEVKATAADQVFVIADEKVLSIE